MNFSLRFLRSFPTSGDCPNLEGFNLTVLIDGLLLYAQFDLLSILHPTPAVCGHPQALAKEAITSSGELYLLDSSLPSSIFLRISAYYVGYPTVCQAE